MKYEQPTINTLGSARQLVQSGTGKPMGNCFDGANQTNANSSSGAYEVDE